MGLRMRRGRYRATAIGAAVSALLIAPALPAAAVSPTFSSVSLTESASGTTVTASTTIKASTTVAASLAGICARNSTAGNVDFPLAAASITTSGTTLTKSKTLNPGNYTYWSCVKVNGTWHDLGTRKSFTVSAAAVTAAAPSGQAMPVGNLPGWKQTFSENFTTNVAMGGFPGPYSAKWMSYNNFGDSSGHGRYEQKIISAHNGELDLYLHTENGVPLGAAPVPLVDGGKWGGQVYGRFSVRFKSDSLPGYGAGWLLWADSGNWNDGEIDFPEGSLSKYMQAFNHDVGNAKVNSLVVSPKVSWTAWHTATIEWKPSSVTFILDGRTIGTDTRNVPKKALHWVLQTATSGTVPAASTAGHLLIDWVSVWAYTG